MRQRGTCSATGRRARSRRTRSASTPSAARIERDHRIRERAYADAAAFLERERLLVHHVRTEGHEEIKDEHRLLLDDYSPRSCRALGIELAERPRRPGLTLDVGARERKKVTMKCAFATAARASSGATIASRPASRCITPSRLGD